MRSEPDKLKYVVVQKPINQHEIGLDVTIAIIGPIAGQRVIPESCRQGNVFKQHSYDRSQFRFEYLPEATSQLSFEILFVPRVEQKISQMPPSDLRMLLLVLSM
jgi:hypothetical protein